MLILTGGVHRVDTAEVAALLGTESLHRASAERVREATGSPSAVWPRSRTRLRCATIVDVTLRPYAQVWAAGGIPHAVFPTTFDELVDLTGGTPADIA